MPRGAAWAAAAVVLPKVCLEKVQRGEGSLERWKEGGRQPVRFWGCSGVQAAATHRCFPCAGALLAVGRFREDCSGLGNIGICVALLFHHFLFRFINIRSHSQVLTS